jgi:hypothetical protein
MFNPFAAFEPRFLSGFRQRGVKAFVQQTYERGRNLLEEDPRPAYLLIHFNNEKKAREHFEAIKTDPGRQLFITDDLDDYRKLQTLLNDPAAGRFYTMLKIKDAELKAQKFLDKRIRSYIDFKTNWRPARYESVHFSLDFIFGEIYVQLKCGARSVKMRIEELENQKYVL